MRIFDGRADRDRHRHQRVSSQPDLVGVDVGDAPRSYDRGYPSARGLRRETGEIQPRGLRRDGGLRALPQLIKLARLKPNGI